MKKSTLLKSGIIGAGIAALCCFTPILVIIFGVVGMAAWVGYLDYILMPVLLFFLLLTIFAVKKKDKEE
ncbi:MAG: mercury resistance system transport protein MerF [Ghiorsea sp.]